MSEYRFAYNPAIPSGRVVFRVFNTGKKIHKLTLLPLPEALPPLDSQLKGPNRVSAEPFAWTAIRKPHEYGAFAVDLIPGRRYGLVCFITDQDGRTHAVKGMNSEFKAAGATVLQQPLLPTVSEVRN